MSQSIPITKRQIQYIQSLRRRLGIDDDTYAAMKSSVGVNSTRDLDNGRFDALIQRMSQVELGRRKRESSEGPSEPIRAGRKSAKPGTPGRRPAPEKRAVLAKIKALLKDIGRDESYADGIARNMFGVDKLAWCDAMQTFRVLQALAVYQRRHKGSQTDAEAAKPGVSGGESPRTKQKEG